MRLGRGVWVDVGGKSFRCAPPPNAWLMSRVGVPYEGGRLVYLLFLRRDSEAWTGLAPRVRRHGDGSGGLAPADLAHAVDRLRVIRDLHAKANLPGDPYDLGGDRFVTPLMEQVLAALAVIVIGELCACPVVVPDAEPEPLPDDAVEPRPLVSQLVDDLVSAPAGPPALPVALAAA